MKKILIISVILLTLISCESKFSNYIEKEGDIYIRLLSFEENTKNLRKKGFGAISIEVYENEKLLYTHHKEELIDLENNKFSFLTKHLSLGDSASFMVPTTKIVNIFKPLKLQETTVDYLSVFIKFDNFFNSDNDKEMVEQVVLKKYLRGAEVKSKSGIYLEKIKEGVGAAIEKGDEITIAYKGYFVSGLEFDNISGRTAFTFAYGSQGQVIKGLNIAIKTMREGQESKIIIPSQLAFGEVGSTTLIVPPFTTVIYDLEIIKVN